MSVSDYQHPAFPQPADPNALLWRYMDYDKFEWLVIEQRLFMPEANQLGDRFEGTSPQGELSWWREQAASAASVEIRSVIEQNRIKISAFARGFQRQYYVSCWHLNNHENQAMWSAYTKTPESVAIKTTFSMLRNCLPSHVELGMVRYIDYSKDRLPTMNMLQYITHKRLQLSFEQEVRAVALGLRLELQGDPHMESDLFELESSETFRVYAPHVNPVKLISRVVLHPEATPEFASQVALLCADRGLPTVAVSTMNDTPAF